VVLQDSLFGIGERVEVGPNFGDAIPDEILGIPLALTRRID
jgi:hypothetical protein